MISREKIILIQHKMLSLGILEKDLEEHFTLGSGRGGQKKQKTSNCVQIKHLPTGILVQYDESRDREENRWLARRKLCERYIDLYTDKKSKQAQEIEKKRKQKRKKQSRSQKKYHINN